MNSTIKFMFDDKEIVLNAKHRISFVEMEEIIDTIVDGVFDNGRYMPSRFDYYYYACILSKYTDFDIEQYSTDDIYKIADDGAFECAINDVIDANQLATIYRSANLCIEAKLNEHPLKSTIDKLNSLMNNGNDIIHLLANNEQFRTTLKKYIAKEDDMKIIKAFDSAIGTAEG